MHGIEALPGFVALAEEVGAWLWARGVRQWAPGSIAAEREELAAKIAEGWLVMAHVTAEGEDRVAGGCVLSRLVPAVWSDREPGGAAAGAAYLERLVVARDWAGSGLSGEIVGVCEEIARRAGLEAVRLDCWAGNGFLRDFYGRLGFAELGAVPEDNYEVRLFEKRL